LSTAFFYLLITVITAVCCD